MNKEQITARVVYWVEHHGYSRQHWETVAQEKLEEVAGDMNKAKILLARDMESFHYMYRDGVVKQDNVLHDILTMAFESVDWLDIANRFYPLKEADSI